MNVSIFGLGYVGSVTAACLASMGHRVVGVDVNADKVETINNGQSPVIEPDLDDLIRNSVNAGNLWVTQDADAAVAYGDVCLICVGTPSNSNGSLHLEYVERVCAQIGQALAKQKTYKVVTLRSTVLPGTFNTQLIPILSQESGKRAGDDFGAVVYPEFLREGSGVRDFREPPFSIIGELDNRSGDALAALHENVSGPVIRTDPDTACMVKYASNAFHGLKVVFANEIGRLCKRLGIDSTEVMEIFCQDTKLNISSRYLRPGFAFGGSCLPKDIRALEYLARHKDIRLPVLESILPSNHSQVQNVVNLILGTCQTKVGIIGLSFKPDTDDLRESPIVELVEILSGKGLVVRIYDENINLSKLIGGNKAFIERVTPHISALMCDSMEEVVEGSEVIVVAHDLGDASDQLIKILRSDQLLIDLVKIAFDGVRFLPAYRGISW